jgi:glycosyltransferase involved in cell wall biosynthesis
MLFLNISFLFNMKYLLAIWTNSPEDYFYIENFINFLKKKKINSILIFKRKNFGKEKNLIKNCKKHKIYSSNNNLLNKLFYFYFQFYIAFLVILKQPKKVYLFNSHTLLAVLIFKPFYSGKIIYHNFDYNPFIKTLSQKFLTFLEKKVSKHFEIIIFSHKKRGELFQKLSNLKKSKIYTIYNSLSKNFIKRKYMGHYAKKKVLYRIGSIGPNHSLDNLIKSMKYLNDDFKLLLCGKVTDKKYFLKIKNLIKKNNLEKKIEIKTSVTRLYWKKKLSETTIGVALYEYNNKNISHKYMVGASQKINAYLASSLPILMSDEKQYLDFNKKYNCAINVDIKSPLNIALSIKKVILNKEKYLILRKNSYKAFINEFNFEKQIEYIKNYI